MAARQYRIAVVKWQNDDGIASVLVKELSELGHETSAFLAGGPFPKGSQVILSFAPYGRFMDVVNAVRKKPPGERPVLVHWNTEGMPDLRIPWPLMIGISRLRAFFDRSVDVQNGLFRKVLNSRFLESFHGRMHRFRYVGEYHYAYRNNFLQVYADSSAIYSRLHNAHGLPTIHAPWGITRHWYADLKLERDIDVLWMGTRGTTRRSRILDKISSAIQKYDVRMHIADNETAPFIFDEERTSMLNRTKIVLNLTRTWFDDNHMRFSFAMPNRALVISEPMLDHCTVLEAGKHYIAAPVERIPDTILTFLQDHQARQKIVDNAYEKVIKDFRIKDSLIKILSAVEPFV